MFIFLYLLAAMGVGYWAKIHGRNAPLWFALGVVLTPIGGSLALAFVDKLRAR